MVAESSIHKKHWKLHRSWKIILKTTWMNSCLMINVNICIFVKWTVRVSTVNIRSKQSEQYQWYKTPGMGQLWIDAKLRSTTLASEAPQLEKFLKHHFIKTNLKFPKFNKQEDSRWMERKNVSGFYQTTLIPDGWVQLVTY